MGEMGDVDDRCLVVNIRGESGMVCVCVQMSKVVTRQWEKQACSRGKERRPPYLVEYLLEVAYLLRHLIRLTSTLTPCQISLSVSLSV